MLEGEAVLTMLGSIMARRTDAGWAVIDAQADLGSGATQHDIARRLGITQQAVSQRLRTALWAEELAARGVRVETDASDETLEGEKSHESTNHTSVNINADCHVHAEPVQRLLTDPVPVTGTG